MSITCWQLTGKCSVRVTSWLRRIVLRVQVQRDIYKAGKFVTTEITWRDACEDDLLDLGIFSSMEWRIEESRRIR